MVSPLSTNAGTQKACLLFMLAQPERVALCTGQVAEKAPSNVPYNVSTSLTLGNAGSPPDKSGKSRPRFLPGSLRQDQELGRVTHRDTFSERLPRAAWH